MREPGWHARGTGADPREQSHSRDYVALAAKPGVRGIRMNRVERDAADHACVQGGAPLIGRTWTEGVEAAAGRVSHNVDHERATNNERGAWV